MNTDDLIRRGLHYLIDNPARVAAGGIGLATALYAIPKLYYILSESSERKKQNIANDRLYDIAMSNKQILNAITPRESQKPDNYNYMFTE